MLGTSDGMRGGPESKAEDEVRAAGSAGFRSLDYGTPSGGGRFAALAGDDEGERGVERGAGGTCCGMDRRCVAAVGAAVVAVAVVIGIAAAFVFRPTALGACEATDWRLPSQFNPSFYSVRWSPKVVAPFDFSGEVNATLVATKDTSCVVMHSDGLTLSDPMTIYVSPDDESKPEKGSEVILVPRESIKTYSQWGMIAIPTGQLIRKGTKVVVRIGFSAPLGQNMNGLYLSSYNTTVDGAQETHYLVATQFEATYARHAFPCLDEPALKAEFQVELTGVPDGFVALSNMPPVDPEEQAYAATFERDAERWQPGYVADPRAGARTVTFQRSVKMSTYLVAVVMGDLAHVEGTTRTGTQVRVWARAELADRLDFALGSGVDVLPYFEDLFQVPFPLPKQDMVAIPDFAAGAMENWGLVTYRETALLANASSSSTSELLRVAVVVAHELSHQWTGNLVTMEFWSSLFLNEGCATLFEYYGTNASHPELGVWSGWYANDPRRAMGTSSFAACHPLVNPNVDSAADIEAMFDDISYSFGGSAIQMVSLTIQRLRGLDAFKDGMATYLNEHKFSTATADEFWESLAAGSGINEIASGMSTWSHASGFPLLFVEWADGDVSDPTRKEGDLRIRQERCFRSPYSKTLAQNGGGASPRDADPVWWVPLTLSAQSPSGEVQTAVNRLNGGTGFSSRTWGTTFYYELDVHGWLKGNLDQAGLFRVTYPPAVWAALQDAVTAQLRPFNTTPLAATDYVFTDNDRAGLVDDLWTVIWNGYAGETGLNIDTPLSYMSTLHYEMRYAVWRPAVGHLSSLHYLLNLGAGAEADPDVPIPAACLDDMNTYAQSIIRPAVVALGWGPDAGSADPPADPAMGSIDAAEKAQLRSVLYSAAVNFGDAAVIAEAQSRWADHRDNGTPIDSNLLGIIADAVVSAGGATEWNEIRAAYEAEQDPGARTTFLYALASASDATLLEQTLDYSLSSNVRSQDTVSLITSVAANPKGALPAWNFLKANFAELYERYGSGGFAASSLAGGTAQGHITQDLFDDVEAFYKSNTFEAAELNIKRALESIKAHILFFRGTTDGRDLDLDAALAPAACTWLAANV